MAKKEVKTPEDELPPVLYLIHFQDQAKKALVGISIRVKSDNGDWSSISNACGDVIDPGTGLAGVTLAHGHYEATFYDAHGIQMLFLHPDGSNTLEPCKWDLAWPPDAPILCQLGMAAYVPGTGTLPPIPTRAQVCAVQTSLQGLTYNTTQYGPIPAWFYAKLNPQDRAGARRSHIDGKDTHIPVPISAAYKEHGTLWPEELKQGYDYTQDLDTFRAILYEVICDGLFPDVTLAGDGLGIGPGYNDPVGNTYGCGWLMQNLERIIRGLQGDGTDARPDLTPYLIHRPGWDAVFYGWGGAEADGHGKKQASQHALRWRNVLKKPTTYSTKELDDQQKRVKAFGELFRKILPAGYLAIEHTPGNIPCGEGGGDYAPGGLMTTFDTIMGEFNTVHEDSYWQIAGRMLDPYHRPPDQPAGDDPNPPKYLAPGSPRGPYFWVGFEPTVGGVYQWCRGLCSVEDVRTVDRYMRDSGCTLTGYSGG